MKAFVKKMSLIIVLLMPQLISAQNENKPLEKPKDIGISEFDVFKNNSFSIYSETKRIEAEVKLLDKDIKSYAADFKNVELEKLKKDYKALKSLQKQLPALEDDIKKISPQSEALLAKTKDISPKQKSIGAIGNTNKSVKALDQAKQNLKDISDILKSDTELLHQALKDRGEEPAEE
jgi:seryl-tRNA synthetase